MQTSVISARLSYWYYMGIRMWHQFRAVYNLLDREKDLAGLITWAKRKRLSGVHKYYRSLQLDCEMSLGDYMIQSPRIVELTRWCYCFWKTINPPPRYRKRGSAAKYRA